LSLIQYRCIDIDMCNQSKRKDRYVQSIKKKR